MVKGTLLVRVGGGFARRPEVAAVGGELGGFGNEFGVGVYEGGGLALDDWVEEDKGVEEAGVHEGELCSGSLRLIIMIYEVLEWMEGTDRCAPPKLCPTPTMGRGISSRFRLMR